MKKFVSRTVWGLLVGLMVTMGSCASIPPQSFVSYLVAGQGESEITLNSSSNVGTLNVYLIGEMNQMTQTMLPKDSVKFVVPNGQYTIFVNWIAKNGFGINVPVKGEPLTVNAVSQSYVFTIELPAFLIGTKVKLKQVSVDALAGNMQEYDTPDMARPGD